MHICLWSSYKATKWSRSISLSNEVWSYFCYFLNFLCDVQKCKLRRQIYSYLLDLSVEPNLTYITLQLIGIRATDQLSLLQLVLGSLTGIGNRKPIFEVNQSSKKIVEGIYLMETL